MMIADIQGHKMKKILIVVDMQKDFVDGALGSILTTPDIEPKLYALIVLRLGYVITIESFESVPPFLRTTVPALAS